MEYFDADEILESDAWPVWSVLDLDDSGLCASI